MKQLGIFQPDKKKEHAGFIFWYISSLVRDLEHNVNHLPLWLIKMRFIFILHFRARPAVQTRTYWKAPIIWEGMFDPNLYDQKHIEGQSSVALTVFAVGRLVSP